MKIRFKIQFHTVWGQNLYISGSIPELGSWNNFDAKKMNYVGNGNWNLDIEIPDQPTEFEYRYFLLSDNQSILEEWDNNHRAKIDPTQDSYTFIDSWQNPPANRADYSSAFTKSWFAHTDNTRINPIKSNRRIIFKTSAPLIPSEYCLGIVGNQPAIGNWDIQQCLLLSSENFPEWSVELDASQIYFPIEFKFCLRKKEDHSYAVWEKGDNRIVSADFSDEKETIVISAVQIQTDEETKWKCAGTVIPVFSLRSEESFGIGDFHDLKKMVDWLDETAQRILQILPVNDTTASHSWRDSYPYNAISIYALHPIYLNIFRMGLLHNSERHAFYSQKQKELNALSEVDYEEVDKYKNQYFREIYEQEGESVLNSEAFRSFFNKNKDWLLPYAAYSYLRDLNGTSNFREWNEYRTYNKEEIEKLGSRESSSYKQIGFYFYLQFHADRQLAEAKEYAHSKRIVLKGDIPIGINKLSVEAWHEPHYFNMQSQTGAPPDEFSTTGQNWGFPTYNWVEMEKDQFRWWKKRFQKMSDYFDAYRIDHILGFFRIWEIPESSIHALLGQFSPALPFSLEEITNSGLNFRKEQFTQACIHEQFLSELFGEYTQEATQTYLDRITASHYALKEKYNTQRKIADFFHHNEIENSKIEKGLMHICNEVLFIEDKQHIDHYHPRISASQSFAYRELDNSDQYAFDLLYWNYFYQRHNHFWRDSGYNKLKTLITSTNMLVCGEDLGMIPNSVPEVMQKLQILSLEIERMPKEISVEFTNLKQLPYLSVCSTSTHDMSPIRSWWKEDQQKTQRYYNEVLRKEGKAPEECSSEICRQIIRNHLEAKSMLTIIPLQDWLSVSDSVKRENDSEERINVPANPNQYWRYRMHWDVEDLISNKDFNNIIRELLKTAGR